MFCSGVELASWGELHVSSLATSSLPHKRTIAAGAQTPSSSEGCFRNSGLMGGCTIPN